MILLYFRIGVIWVIVKLQKEAKLEKRLIKRFKKEQSTKMAKLLYKKDQAIRNELIRIDKAVKHFVYVY